MAASRRVNVRFLGVLVGTLAILGPSVYFVNAYQVRRNSDALKNRATKAFDDGNYTDAAKYYYLYLKQHPDDKLELCLPSNELGMLRDDKKTLLKFKRAIEKVLPEKALKHLGM